jgi:asparagine synthase (glutamine-hydrolysing)
MHSLIVTSPRSSTPCGVELPEKEVFSTLTTSQEEARKSLRCFRDGCQADEVLRNLRGDWCLATGRAQSGEALLANSAFGNSALYYHRSSDAVYVATSITELLDYPEVPKRPNLLRVAQVLTSWSTDGESTGYEGIYRVPPAHTVTIRGSEVSKRRYWFPENAAPLALGSDEEYAEAFLSVFDQAVRRRMEGGDPVGGTLSGGLDSSSVCALAARALRERGGRLPVFTSIPRHTVEYSRPRSFHDESPFVEATRAHCGNVDVHAIPSDDVTPLAGTRRLLELLDEPAHGPGNFYWIASLMNRAKALGLKTLLTGQNGNGSISYAGHPTNAWRCLATGDLGLLARNLPRSADEFWPALKRHWLVPPLHVWRMWRKQQQPIAAEPWLAYSAIRPEFARSLKLGELMQESGHDPRFIMGDRRAERLATLRLGYNVGGSIWAAVSQGYGIEVRDPTSDEDVVEFCLRVPEEQYCVRGQYRSLIRRAMKGLLPDVVRLNERRGKQAEDLAYRIRAEKAAWVEALVGLELSPLARDVLDLPRMRRLLDSLDAGITREKTDQCMMVLTRGMMAGEFLKRFD